MRSIAATILLLTTYSITSAGEMTPVGPGFVVTSRISNDQHHVWVTADDKGNFAVAYAQGDVYFRRLDRDGNPLGSDFLVNPTLNSGNQSECMIACDPASGDLFVGMSDLGGQDGSGESCIGRFFSADGTPRGPEQFLNVNTTESQFNPKAAFAVDGTVLIAWADAGTDGSVGVVGRIYDRNGTPQTGEFLVNAPSDKTQIQPSVAASREGTFCVAYTDKSGATGEPHEILFRLFDSNGTALSSELLANSISTGSQRLPEVAMDADGDFVIVWEDESATDGDGYGVYGRLFNSDGTPKGPQFPICQITAGDQTSPHVVMDYVGNFAVCWETDTYGTGDVYVRRFDRFGNPVTNDVRVHDDASGEQVDVRIALNQSGERMIATWHDGPDNNGDAYARIFDTPTIEFTGQAVLTGTVDVEVEAPGMGGSLYMILPSLLETPALGVNGIRTVDVGVDSLLLFALTTPESGIFSQIVGTLDPAGKATGSFTIPDSAAYYGLPVRFAALTLDAGFSGTWDLGTNAIDGIEYLSDVRTVTVAGPVRFHPGQALEGDVATAGDEDRASFEALKGSKVKLKVQQIIDPLVPNPAEKMRLEVYDANGVFVKGLNAKPGKKKKSKLKLKVKKDGTYFLHVTSSEELIGSYRFETSLKSKKNAKEKTKVLKIDKTGAASTKISAVAGTTLSVSIKPTGAALPLGTLALESPTGEQVSVQSFLSSDGSKLIATGIPLPTTGKFKVTLTGVKGHKYKVTLTPTAPSTIGVVELE